MTAVLNHLATALTEPLTWGELEPGERAAVAVMGLAVFAIVFACGVLL